MAASAGTAGAISFGGAAGTEAGEGQRRAVCVVLQLLPRGNFPALPYLKLIDEEKIARLQTRSPQPAVTGGGENKVRRSPWGRRGGRIATTKTSYTTPNVDYDNIGGETLSSFPSSPDGTSNMAWQQLLLFASAQAITFSVYEPMNVFRACVLPLSNFWYHPHLLKSSF